MMPGKPQATGAVQVRGTDDGCCGVFFLKYVLYIFNFILLLSGLAILGVGLWTFLAKHWYADLLGPHGDIYTVTTYLLIATGGLIVLIVFIIGCCATCNKNRLCLMLYAGLLLLVFLLEVGTGILAYMYENLIHDELSQVLRQTMIDRYIESPASKMAVDELQKSSRCCGSLSYRDWLDESNKWQRLLSNGTQRVPDSCCINIQPNCGTRLHPSNINVHGCLKVFEEDLQCQLIVMGAVGLGLCLLQIFGIIFSCCLAKRVRKWNTAQQDYWQ